MIDIKSFFNKEYKKLSPIEKEDYRNIFNLSSNEAHHAGYKKLLDEFILEYNTSSVTKYPVFNQAHDDCSLYHKVNPNQLILVPGSDFGINLLINAIGLNSEGLVTHNPNYIGYTHYAALNNIAIHTFPVITVDVLKNFKNHLVAIANPEGFLGSVISFDKMMDIATACDIQNNILIIDEAYIEFNKFDHCELINSFNNVIIIRSYSKGMGLASMRVGSILANPDIIDYLSRFSSENCITDFSLSYLTFLLNKINYVKAINFEVCALRDSLIESLRKLMPDWHVYNTNTNFITIATRSKKEAVEIYVRLLEEKIRIRHIKEVSEYLNCIRIAIPPKENINELIERLFEFHMSYIC